VAKFNSLSGRRANLLRQSQNDGSDLTRAARAGFRRKFEQQVDPDGVLPADERARRAQAAFDAHMLDLAQHSAKKRRKGMR
jgi:hypothetical protein